MTIDEAIAHAMDVAIEQSSMATELSLAGTDASECIKCKQEHEQLAEWLQELKQYREIGTVNEFKSLKEDWLNKFDSLIEYRKIGTIEECRAAVEKQKTKKPTPIDYKKYMDVVKNAKFLKGAFWCPNCNHVIRSGNYCDDCGQKLDWSDEND